MTEQISIHQQTHLKVLRLPHKFDLS